jgi:hypothetical protein
MPVLQKMISTFKKIPSLAEYNKYLSSFESLMELSYNNRNKYISDHDFINHGFNPDIDADRLLRPRSLTTHGDRGMRRRA